MTPFPLACYYGKKKHYNITYLLEEPEKYQVEFLLNYIKELYLRGRDIFMLASLGIVNVIPTLVAMWLSIKTFTLPWAVK